MSCKRHEASLVDLTAAQDRLSELPGVKKPGNENSRLRATGADDSTPRDVVLPVAFSSVPTRHELSRAGSPERENADPIIAISPGEAGVPVPSCIELSAAEKSTPDRNRTCNLRIRSRKNDPQVFA